MRDGSVAARRVSGCAARGFGGGGVVLKMAAPPVAGDDGEQLGLAEPQFSDVPVTDAVMRADGRQVLLPADAVHAALGMDDVQAVLKTLSEAAGVVTGQEWRAIVSAEAVSFFGVPCLYRIKLREF